MCHFFSTAERLRKWAPVLQSIVEASKDQGNGDTYYICHQSKHIKNNTMQLLHNIMSQSIFISIMLINESKIPCWMVFGLII